MESAPTATPGGTPLTEAARHGRAADVAALLAGGADVNEPKTDGSGVTALHIACYFGRAEIVTKQLPLTTPAEGSASSSRPADGVQFAMYDREVAFHGPSKLNFCRCGDACYQPI